MNNLDLDDLLQNLIKYKNDAGNDMIDIYNKEAILASLEDPRKIENIEKEIKKYENGVDLAAFVRLLLMEIDHTSEETLFLAIGSIELFEDILKTYQLKKHIKHSNLVDYIIDVEMSKEEHSYKIPTKIIPEKSSFKKSGKIREIDLNPPIVSGATVKKIYKLNKEKIRLDQYHRERFIKRGIYDQKLKIFFTLDFLGREILLYSNESTIKKAIKPAEFDSTKSSVIVDFGYSTLQKRIGATLKNFHFSFWEHKDNYQYEKSFSIIGILDMYQTKIWYIEYLDIWLTTDASNMLNPWDLRIENLCEDIRRIKLKANLINLVEIFVLKLICMGTSDHIISLWDIKTNLCYFRIDMGNEGITSLVWSDSHQLLMSSNFSNNINLWSINARHFDHEHKGTLTGHKSLITSIDSIEGTPLMISADDTGILKLWDVRELHCIQTCDIENRMKITGVISAISSEKIACIGSRVAFIDLELVANDLLHTNQNSNQADKLSPIALDYVEDKKELILCTKRDVRIINYLDGRLTKIFVGLIDDKAEQIDLTDFKMISNQKQFVVSNIKGMAAIHSYSTGELLMRLNKHKKEILFLKADLINNMVLSVSSDGELVLQSSIVKSPQTFRTINNLYKKKEVALVEISVYHNIILTASSSNHILFWDYEFFKLQFILDLNENYEPMAAVILNYIPIIILSDSNGKILLFSFEKNKLNHKLDVKLIHSFKVETNDIEYSKRGNLFANKITNIIDFERSKLKISLYTCLTNGNVNCYDLTTHIEGLDFKDINPAYKKQNYNSHRVFNEDYLVSVDNQNIPQDSIQNINPSQFEPLFWFKAHKDVLLGILLTPEKDHNIITWSTDQFVKIWSSKGKLLSSLNLNFPLPQKWSINIDTHKDPQKVYKAIAVMDDIMAKNKNSRRTMKDKFTITPILNKAFHGDSVLITQVNIEDEKKEKKQLTMEDEYDVRDFLSDKRKQIYEREIQGPSLKQYEMIKTLVLSQKQVQSFRNKKNPDYYDEVLKSLKETEHANQMRNFMNFLVDENSKPKSFYKKHYEPKVEKFSKQLDQQIKLNRNSMLEQNQKKEAQNDIKATYKISKKTLYKTNKQFHSTGNISSKEDVSNFTTKTVNFFDYANFKLPELDSKLNTIQGSFITPRDTSKANTFEDKRAEQKNFKLILETMNENIRKSQKLNSKSSTLYNGFDTKRSINSTTFTNDRKVPKLKLEDIKMRENDRNPSPSDFEVQMYEKLNSARYSTTHNFRQELDKIKQETMRNFQIELDSIHTSFPNTTRANSTRTLYN